MGKKDRNLPGAPSPSQIEAGRRGLMMTQEEAAALAMVSQSTWAGWESGARPMHPWIWAKWVELAPAEGKRLRPFFFVNPKEVKHVPQMPAADSSISKAMEEIAGSYLPARAQEIAQVIAQYGLTDADCVKAIRGITPEAWQLMKSGRSMHMTWADTVGALMEYGKSTQAHLAPKEEAQPESNEAI